jgi:hypothetical protein
MIMNHFASLLLITPTLIKSADLIDELRRTTFLVAVALIANGEHRWCIGSLYPRCNSFARAHHTFNIALILVLFFADGIR